MNEKCKTCGYAYRYKGEATYCLLYNQLKDNCADYEEVKQPATARKAEEKCCGACAFMIGESPYGDGTCAKIFAETVYCGDKCHGDHFVSKEDMERAVKVLEAHNKWRRDNNVPNSQPMVDPRELGKAIDLAILFCKTFMDL